MQAGPEVIATQVRSFEIKLGKGMRAVHDRFYSFGTRHLADRFHRSDLAGDIDLMRDQDKAGAIGHAFFKRSGDLVEVLRRNGNLNELELKIFTLLPLTQRGQHAW